MFVSAIIAAGGRGQRFGGPVPKQLLDIGGASALERSVALFMAHPQVHELVVALPADLVEHPPAYLRGYDKPLRIVVGGERRQDSVRHAFDATNASADIVVIHDAARPFASPDLIARTIAAAAQTGAALAATASRDTVKRSNGASDALVVETIPRETVYLAQTPQAFTRRVLTAALMAGQGGPDATDEAALAERAGFPVRLVDGEQTNIKLTTPEDLLVVDAIARGQTGRPETRIGTGYDLHRLVEGRPLVIGGVVVPFEKGPLGHSDGDVVCHAVTDAVLGAASRGDIGRHFPDTDPTWKGADSVALLRAAVAMVTDAGYRVVNADITVVLERPKIKPHIDQMRTIVAGALGVDAAFVSIKGKTNEGVDAVGRGEAIAAHAVALIERA